MSTEEEIREYFTDDDWNNMCPAEKSLFLNFKVIMQITNDNEIIYEGIECEATNSPQIPDKIQEIEDDNNTVLTNANLHCQDCKQKYTNFCLNCQMLSSILDNDVRLHVYNRIIRTLPKNILYITNKIDAKKAIFAHIDIPCQIYFGPCEGLQIIHDRNEYLWRFEGDRLKSVDDSCTNWMIYVRHVKNASNANLTVLQCDSSLYFRTIRKINRSEELVVYFDEKNFELSEKSKLYYRPRLDTVSKNIYACTFCCLGFSSEKYLVRHKKICLYMTTERKTPREIVQCPFCKIYLDEWEYMEFHMTCCCEKNSRKCLLPIADNEQQNEVVKPPPKQYSNESMKLLKCVRNEKNLTQVLNMPVLSQIKNRKLELKQNSSKLDKLPLIPNRKKQNESQKNSTRLERPSNQTDDRKLINPLTKLVINENFKRIMLCNDKKLNQSNIDVHIDSSSTALNKIQNVINPVYMIYNSKANILKAATKTSEDIIESGNLTNQVNADKEAESFLRKLNLGKVEKDKMVNGLDVEVKKDYSRILRKRKDIEGMYTNALWENDLKIREVENEKPKKVIKEDSKIGEKYFKCNYCPRSFRTFCNFKLHLHKEHNTTEYTINNDIKFGETCRKPNVQCRCCFKCFDNTIERDKHERFLHKQEKILKHNFRSRTEKQILKKAKIKGFHNVKTKKGRRKYFKCNDCPRSFRTISNFKLHLLKEHNTTEYVNNKDEISQEEQRMFRSRYCFKRYDRLAPKLLHEKDVHKEEYISNHSDENITREIEIESIDDLISESIKQEIVDLENEENAQTIINFINQLEANGKDEKNVIGKCVNEDFDNGNVDLSDDDCQEYVKNSNFNYDNVGSSDSSHENCEENVKNIKFGNENVGIFVLSDESCQENVKRSKNIEILNNFENQNLDEDLNVVNSGENTKISAKIGAYGRNVGIKKKNTFLNDEEPHFSGENNDIEEKPKLNDAKSTETTLHDCRLCTKQFKTVKELETHIHVIPSEGNRYECANCGYKTNNKLCLERHMINTHISKGFKTNNVASTGLHGRRSEALFSCFICNFGYLRVDQLEEHLSETHKVNENYYKCDECNYKTDRLAKFLEHHLKKHKKRSERRNATNDVNKLIRNINDELYKCKVCYQMFRQKETLKEHIRYKHFENAKKFQCPKCIFTTDYKRNLVRHLYTHEEIKPFNCEQCNKSFIRKEHYDLHALYHKKTSLYQCSDCDYGSNNRYCIKRHRRQVHHDELC